MKMFSDPGVTKRFIKYMAIATVLMFSLWAVIKWAQESERNPGDYETRRGDIELSDGNFEKAIASFDAALAAQPKHRGAWGGKAAALIQLNRYPEAEAELTGLIDYLEKTLVADDLTGRGALAAAYGNRGILRDRQGRYEEALKDYIASAKTDRGLAEGPGWVNRLLYHNDTPSSILARAQYIYEQLKLPKGERVLRLPEEDAKQRLYKP